MRRVFVDSFYFFALLNPHDPANAWAAELAKEFDGAFVTTEPVLTEVADGLARRTLRHLFATCELYRARPDKDWSLPDCISFMVMEREGLTEALTGDHHFEQAGFVPLLK